MVQMFSHYSFVVKSADSAGESLILEWRQSNVGIMPAVAEIVCGLIGRQRAGARLAPTGDLMETAGGGLGKFFRLGTCYE